MGWYWGRPRAAPVETALRLAAAMKGVGGRAGEQHLAALPDDTPLQILAVPSGPEVWVVHGCGHIVALARLLPLPPSGLWLAS